MRREAPSRTAEMMALARAAEQHRPAAARIVDDPFARHFLGPSMTAALAALRGGRRVAGVLERHGLGLAAYVLARHRFIDDRLRAALGRRRARPRQVVILGAGYDMRAHRLSSELGLVPVYEVDHPATAARKARIIEKLLAGGLLRARRAVRVDTDFHHQPWNERLRAAGFMPGARTFVVWEGVSMYLTRDAVQSTLATLRKLCGPQSELVLDFWYLLDEPDLRSAAHRWSASLLHFLGEPILFGIHPQDVEGFLHRQGFELDGVATKGDLRERYVSDGRPVYPATYVACARIGASKPPARGS